MLVALMFSEDPARPPSRFLTARWVHLVMSNYAVDPRVLAPLVPRGVVLDTVGGRTLISMVGFQFLDTRVLGVPIPFHRDFEEVNLRFYVRREVGGEVRRGVVFVKEIVPRRAIAWVARTLYGERYVALPMDHDDEIASGEGRVEYRWRLGGRWHRLGATVHGEPALPAPGSEEEFVTEHYWGYAAQRDGGTVEYRVEHPRWRVWSGGRPVLQGDFASLYGDALAGTLRSHPASCFVAEGSEVLVRRGVRIDP